MKDVREGARIHQEAKALKALGVKSGDRVGLLLSAPAERSWSQGACSQVGAIAVALGALSAEGLVASLQDRALTLVITTMVYKPLLEAALQQGGHRVLQVVICGPVDQALSEWNGLRDIALEPLVARQTLES